MEANPPYYQTTPRRHFTADANANPFPGVDPEYDIPSATALAPPHHVFHPGEHGSENDIEHIAGGGANGSHINHSLEGAHDLHGLVEAATTAANLAAEAMTLESSQNQSSTRGNNNHSTRGKRRRASTPTSDNDNDNNANANTQNAQGEGPNPRKRARTQLSHPPTTTDPQMQTRASSDSLLGEARAAGVHSAAALFRQASSKGGPKRKYTRPPMANLFMSLRLTPENFLQLQARAKAYMLDPAHPDRQSCVGNRGKGDNDMVKLKLFNCVRDFLVEGVGEQFFGEGVEVLAEEETVEAARALGQVGVGGQEERLVWPRDGNKIISLVTPLLRRMVTNERQRVYALQTRKGGGKKNEEGVGGSRGQSLELQTVGVGEESLEGQRVQRYDFRLSLSLSLRLLHSHLASREKPIANIPPVLTHPRSKVPNPIPIQTLPSHPITTPPPPPT